MALENGNVDNYLDGATSTPLEVLERVEPDVAYSSERAFLLETLSMQVKYLENDYEALSITNEDFSTDSVEKAFVFFNLSGILNSEIKELDGFVASVQVHIFDAWQKLTESCHSKEMSEEIKEKLVVAEYSLQKTEDKLADLRSRSAEYEEGLAFARYGTRIVANSCTQERRFLQMLEKSLARELYLQKKLSDSTHNEEQLKLQLLHSEELMEVFIQRIFEAENASETLLGSSKELSGKLQVVQFNQRGSVYRQNDVRTEMEKEIEGLREDVLRLESRAESAEERCALLTKTNFELDDQQGFLRKHETERVTNLERKLKESDLQLEHARASVEAIEEQQKMLYSALSDMENLIEDLKGKVSKAEGRAERAESKCTLLTETNLELNEELDFLRSRLESMETFLNQADAAKIATAKDIGMKTKFITDLVMKLASERERLQLQLSVFAKQNQILSKKCLKTKDSGPYNACEKDDILNNYSTRKSSEETPTASATTNIEEDRFAAAQTSLGTRMETTISAAPEVETVRTIEATQLNIKYLFMALIVLLVSMLAIYLVQLEY